MFRGLVVLMIASLAFPVLAKDPSGQYANSPNRVWMEQLRSGKGPCCSDADGYVVEDADWESKDGHYRVRIPIRPPVTDKPYPELVWVVVEETAVITEPNRIGRTMVWPIWGYMGASVRCFMPGSMT